MTVLTVSMIDEQANPTSTRLRVADAITDPQAQAIADAIAALSLGSDPRAVVTVPNIVDAGSAVIPTDPMSRVGNKWLYRLQDDTTGNIYTNEIGCADNDALPTGNDFLDLSAGLGQALATAIDAAWESPAGNSGSLLSVQQVNRKAA